MEVLKNIIFTLKNSFIFDKKFIYLSIIFFVFLFIYWGRFGDIVIDCGREAFIPYAMADSGKVLFKDLICIYGPLPYYLNALMVKFFGANLNTMYFIGALLSFLLLFGLYNLAKCFFNERLAFIYNLIILFSCILNPSISNCIFPYSYAIVYALVFAIFHLIFLFKFIAPAEHPDSRGSKYLIISVFFISLCLLSKLDFLFCILPVLAVIFKYRKTLSTRAFVGICLSFLLPFFIVLVVLIFQNVSLQNLIFNFKMISNMARSSSLEYFYSVCTGYFFDFKKTFMFVPQFLCISLIMFTAGILGYLVSKVKNNFFKIFIYFVLTIASLALFFHLELVRYIFLYLPLLVLILFLVKKVIFILKKIKTPSFVVSNDDTIICLFILFSLLFSLKTLFGLFHELYGVFYLPFILLSFMIVIKLLFQNRQTCLFEVFKTTGIIVIALFFIQNFLLFFGEKTTPVKTPAGLIYTGKASADVFNRAFDFLEKKMKPDETLLVLPEGLMFNFALKKDYKFFNTSFTPLDFDAYGEEYLAESLSKYVPEYLLLILRDYSDYGKSSICIDFGQKFCAKINELYNSKDVFHDENFSSEFEPYIIRIFERKTND